jgi:hypothetical protein
MPPACLPRQLPKEREIPKTGKNGVDYGRARHGGQDPGAASPQG